MQTRRLQQQRMGGLMSAQQLHLETWLHEAVLAGSVTQSEAWQVQDQILASQEEFVPMPSHLSPVMQRLHLHEAELPPKGH